MIEPRAELLGRLLAVTPEPPETSAEALLEAFEVMHAARAEVLAAADGTVPAGPPGERVVLDELLRRDAAWLDALARARDAVGHQRGLVGKLRAYAPEP